MSSAVISTSAALGRPFIFDEETESKVCQDPGEKKPARKHAAELADLVQSTIKNQQSAVPLTPASRLEIRPSPEMASSGIPALDALTGGLPRGCLTEICGSASSGRTSVLLAALAAATRRGEYCALIDASDTLDPCSAAAASIDLDRLLWVRCGEVSNEKTHSPRRYPSTPLRASSDTEKTKERKQFASKNSSPGAIVKGTASAVPYSALTDVALAAGGQHLFSRKQSEHRLEQVLRATDLLLESGGFGLIVLDLADLPPQSARRIPLTTWFRFRRAVEHKPTILLAIEQQPIAGSCSSLLLQLQVPSSPFSVRKVNREQAQQPSHTELLTRLEIQAEMVRSRMDRKPATSVTFAAKTAWAG